MRNLLLSVVLIAIPVAGFALVETVMPTGPSTAAPAGLGDLSSYEQIVTDTQTIAQTGDLAAAKQRITDLETLWDDNAAALRKADPGAWSAIDSAAAELKSSLGRTRATTILGVSTWCCGSTNSCSCISW